MMRSTMLRFHTLWLFLYLHEKYDEAIPHPVTVSTSMSRRHCCRGWCMEYTSYDSSDLKIRKESIPRFMLYIQAKCDLHIDRGMH